MISIKDLSKITGVGAGTIQRGIKELKEMLRNEKKGH